MNRNIKKTYNKALPSTQPDTKNLRAIPAPVSIRKQPGVNNPQKILQAKKAVNILAQAKLARELGTNYLVGTTVTTKVQGDKVTSEVKVHPLFVQEYTPAQQAKLKELGMIAGRFFYFSESLFIC